MSNLVRPRLGVSACLLGNPVRFDGGHKRDRFVTDVLAEHCDLQATCPEAGAGLGTPRPTLRLVGDPDSPRVQASRDASVDVTDLLTSWSAREVQRLPELDGFVLKKDSPSCGRFRTKVYRANGTGAERNGMGVFARALLDSDPALPVEDEGRLRDPVLREHFVMRVFLHAELRALRGESLSLAALQDFHARHKALLSGYADLHATLGRMLADGGDDLADLWMDYRSALMMGVERPLQRRHHRNILQRMVGRMRRGLDADGRVEMHELIAAYARGEVPLAVPLALLRHHLRGQRDSLMARQSYLQPYPSSLGLASAV